jgi:hypothetical protein
MVQQTKECYYAAPLYFDTEKLDRVSSLCNEKILNSILMIGLLYKKLHAQTDPTIPPKRILRS